MYLSDTVFGKATMGVPLVASLVCALPTPFYMVARFTGRPTLTLSGTRARSTRLFIVSDVETLGTMPESAGDALPLFPKERPSAEQAKEWAEKARPLLKPDETSIVDGDEPRSLLVYKHSSVPAALIADGSVGGMPGISSANVATRDAQRQVSIDSNLLKDDQRASHLSVHCAHASGPNSNDHASASSR